MDLPYSTYYEDLRQILLPLVRHGYQMANVFEQVTGMPAPPYEASASERDAWGRGVEGLWQKRLAHQDDKAAAGATAKATAGATATAAATTGTKGRRTRRR